MRIFSLLRIIPLKKVGYHKYCTKSEAPVAYTSSNASTWKAEYTRRGRKEEEEETPFQMYSVVISVASFLLYFCVLREENDIDEKIGSSIYDKIDGLEEVQLRRALQYNLESGKDTAEIKLRLKQLEQARHIIK